MDKSFNDDELSDIMKEIEALEQDFKEEDVKAATPVMEELAEMSEEEAIPTPVASTTSNVVAFEKEAPVAHAAPSKPAATHHTAAPTSASHTSMSFKVQGNLSLELSFDIGGKVVSLEVTETGLNIEMDGGVKFTVPVTGASAAKKAA